MMTKLNRVQQRIIPAGRFVCVELEDGIAAGYKILVA